MNGLTAELYALAGELEAAGVPATVDPGQVLRLITQRGVCALLEPADVQPGLGLAALNLECPVRLLTSAPYDHDAVERLDAALLLALPVVQPRVPVGWDIYDAQDTELPSRPMVAHRRIPNPLTAQPLKGT